MEEAVEIINNEINNNNNVQQNEPKKEEKIQPQKEVMEKYMKLEIKKQEKYVHVNTYLN